MIGKNNFKYFLLEDGDIVQALDEYYNPKEDKWLPVDDGEMDDGYFPDAIIGYKYDHEEHKPIRRKNPGVKTLDVINNDAFEGESVERSCIVIEELGKKTMIVQLSSDPSIKCLVKLKDKRWEIIENIE